MNPNSYIRIALFTLAILVFQSCYYKPFIGYQLNKKGFKNFSKAERVAGDNANPQRDYHVNRYDWAIEIFPEKKKISGRMDITFTARAAQDTFLFDLQKSLKIDSIASSHGSPSVKRKGDLLYFIFDEVVHTDTRIELSIAYAGKPVNVAGEGPIQWKEDEKGRTWISSVTEGIGPHFMMPCNALLRAEPDSVTIAVTVPDDLVVAANGMLTSVEDHSENQTKTYTHEVVNRINIYNISFNVGHFVELVKPYTDINGVERELSFQVLDYHRATADTFYDQTPMVLKELEMLYGAFPFWEDGCKFIESTFSAMEHQSGIAMGNDYRYDWKNYNLTLIHELSHEWWGNSITGYDYCDIWIHEGMATYSEALVLEKLYGAEGYELLMRYNAYGTENTIPILKECDVLYNSWTNSADQDIYDKGALMMHSLRKVVDNDDLFFATLRTLSEDFPHQNLSTIELRAQFNELLGQDYSDLFDWYLLKAKPPVLEVFPNKDSGLIYYRWREDVPFYPNGVIYLKREKETLSLVPTTDYQSVKVKIGDKIEFLPEKSIYHIIDFRKKK
ncbi:M1 family aminopeptidase [Cryomorphaceae bacterium 1068]|nr:M1 family aminopeptidase [Cryomorphaceae bacterium 1068]